MDSRVLDAIIERFTAMKAGWDAAVTLDRMRHDLDALIASYAPDFPFSSEPVDAGGVPAEWVVADGVTSRDALLHLHGGGFATGSIAGTRNLAAYLSREAGCRVLVLGYRLAPEHPFPAALDDAVAAWRWMCEPAIARRVAIGGDSAGGGLALSTMQESARRGLPRAACAILLTAWADLRCESASYDTNASRDPVASREMAKMMAATYLGAARSALDPRATPVLGTCAGIAPLLIQAAGRDVFLDDSRAIALWARAGGVDVTLDVWDDMIHQWQQYASILPEARRAVAALGAFVRRGLDTPR